MPIRIPNLEFLKVSFGLTIASLIIGALGYLYQVIMGRLLQPAEFALFSAMMALYAVIGSPLGAVNMILSRHVAGLSATGQRENLKKFYVESHKKIIICTLIIVLLMLFFNEWVKTYLKAQSASQIFILIALVGMSPILTINTAFLQGLKAFKVASISAILGVNFKIILSAILIYFHFGVAGALTGVLFSIIFTWLLESVLLRKRIRRERELENQISTKAISTKTILPVMLANIGFIGILQSDIIFVNYFFEPETAGMYAAASVLGKVVLYLPGGILMALFPMVSENQAKNQGSTKLLLEAIRVTLIICGSASLIYFFFSQEIIQLAYGERYLEAAEILKWYGFAILPMALVMVAEHFLIAKGRVLFCWIYIFTLPLEFLAIYLWHQNLMTILFIKGIFGLFMITLGYGILTREWLKARKFNP